tara:strand:- start:555 stop:743 length:189 start_codon:yes stop_codon:yes gene_type:complete
MNLSDSWARLFVVIAFLCFGEAQIIGEIFTNLTVLGLFFSGVGYFTLTKNNSNVIPLKRSSK